jgi:hypothetical protein
VKVGYCLIKEYRREKMGNSTKGSMGKRKKNKVYKQMIRIKIE